MRCPDVISLASTHLARLVGHEFDVLDVAKPVSPEAAVNLAKIISKLSPMVGNLIEFNTCEYLNAQPGFAAFGKWQRQDPGFPDTVFVGDVSPTPGFEIKAWYALATEITARFKDSQNHFADDRTYVALLAWLPEYLIYGKPKIIDIVIVSGASVAKARDDHYHNLPDYLVLEPGNTTARTRNLQQTTTSGNKFQGTLKQLEEAQEFVRGWGANGGIYLPTPDYQQLLRELTARYQYRPDSNFSKMDRIAHEEIRTFKTRVLSTQFHGRTVRQWKSLLARRDKSAIRDELAQRFDIRDQGQAVVE
jgi:hypothetical protein